MIIKTQRQKRVLFIFFECLYFTYFSLLWFEILHDLLLLQIGHCGIVKLLIETLDLRHNTYMPVLHVFHVLHIGKRDLIVNLHIKLWVLF